MASGDVTIVHTPLVYVSWGCRRCGHRGGMAKTTFPIGEKWTEAMGRVMFDTLRQKLVRRHQERHGCIAVPTDFIIERFDPYGKTDKRIVGVVDG